MRQFLAATRSPATESSRRIACARFSLKVRPICDVKSHGSEINLPPTGYIINHGRLLMRCINRVIADVGILYS